MRHQRAVLSLLSDGGQTGDHLGVAQYSLEVFVKRIGRRVGGSHTPILPHPRASDATPHDDRSQRLCCSPGIAPHVGPILEHGPVSHHPRLAIPLLPSVQAWRTKKTPTPHSSGAPAVWTAVVAAAGPSYHLPSRSRARCNSARTVRSWQPNVCAISSSPMPRP